MHSLLLLPGYYPRFSPVYARISEYLLKNYAVVYAAESYPGKVIMKMRQHRMNVEELIKSRKLAIIDRNDNTLPSSLFGTCKRDNIFANTLIASNRNQSGVFNKGSRSKKFVIFLSPPDALLLHSYRNSESEQQVPTVSSFEHLIDAYDKIIRNLSVVEIICCYTDEMFRELSLSEVIGILDCHKFVVKSSWKQKAISQRLIVDLVERGIDNLLGTGSCSLIFRTLKLVYKMNAVDSMFISPHRFETILSRIIGNQAGRVIDSVKQEIVRNLISYKTSMHVAD